MFAEPLGAPEVGPPAGDLRLCSATTGQQGPPRHHSLRPAASGGRGPSQPQLLSRGGRPPPHANPDPTPTTW